MNPEQDPYETSDMVTEDLAIEAIESVMHEMGSEMGKQSKPRLKHNLSIDVSLIETAMSADEGMEGMEPVDYHQDAVDEDAVTTPEAQKVEAFDYDSIAVNMMKFQVEHHFSDDNLAVDNRMLSKLHNDPEYWVSIKSILAISQIAAITEDPEIVKKAVHRSEMLILNHDETKIKRKDFIPPKPRHHKNMRRTIFIYGLSPNDGVHSVKAMCEGIGGIHGIIFDDGKRYIFRPDAIKAADLEPIDREVAVAIMTRKFGPKAVRSNSASFEDAMSPNQTSAWLQMEQHRVSINPSLDNQRMTHSLSLQIPDSSQAPNAPVFIHPVPNPNGDPLDFSHLKSCFVVFQSQSLAQKFVKSRARTIDGIRALQLYEYIKYQKKLCMNKASGISALMSPNSIKLTLNSPTFAILGARHQANRSSHSSRGPSHSHSHSRPSRPSQSPLLLNASPRPHAPKANVAKPTMYNLEPVQRPQMDYYGSPQGSRSPAMEYFISGHFQDGLPTVVPEAEARALNQQFEREMSLKASPNKNMYGSPRNGKRNSNNNSWSNRRDRVHGTKNRQSNSHRNRRNQHFRNSKMNSNDWRESMNHQQVHNGRNSGGRGRGRGSRGGMRNRGRGQKRSMGNSPYPDPAPMYFITSNAPPFSMDNEQYVNPNGQQQYGGPRY